MDELRQLGHDLVLYEDSEQSDINTNDFDALFQSIYDIVQVASFGIVEEDEKDIQEAIIWLKKAQIYTQKYKELSLEF